MYAVVIGVSSLARHFIVVSCRFTVKPAVGGNREFTKNVQVSAESSAKLAVDQAINQRLL